MSRQVVLLMLVVMSTSCQADEPTSVRPGPNSAISAIEVTETPDQILHHRVLLRRDYEGRRLLFLVLRKYEEGEIDQIREKITALL